MARNAVDRGYASITASDPEASRACRGRRGSSLSTADHSSFEIHEQDIDTWLIRNRMP
jgi:hypothetical protein